MKIVRPTRAEAMSAEPNDEIRRLRAQVRALEEIVAEQETSITFLRDLLTERWFDVAS